MGQEQRIDIVLTTWMREEFTHYCINALKQNTKTPYRLIIVDNGSSSVDQQLYLEKSDIYVRLDKNYGLEHAKWVGMTFVESELFVSLDNDILVYKYDPDWLSQLIKLMEKYPDYGAIALRPQVLVGTSLAMFSTSDEVVPFSHVPGYARIMRTKWVNEVGAWKDKRPLRGHEEMWIGAKFAEKGWKMGWSNNLRCWHLFGREDTDEWGYAKGSTPESHGHNPVWPMPKNDRDEIERGVGMWVMQ